MNQMKMGILAVATVLALGGPAVALGGGNHARVRLWSVDDSGVTGVAQLHQLPGGGTRIQVQAAHLTPGDSYLSLYYENATCELEEDSLEDDVISGGPYTANAGGMGHVAGTIDEDLDEIGSISVRMNNDDHTLLACGEVEP